MADLMHRVEGVVILDDEGERLFAQYYGEPFEGKLDKQLAFEQKIYEKTHQKHGTPPPKEGGDITLVDSHAVIFRLDPEVYFYVFGSLQENEIIMSAVLTCLTEVMSQLLRSPDGVEKRALLEKYGLLCLVVDEILDDGYVMQAKTGDVFQTVYPHAQGGQDAAAKLKKAIKKRAQGVL